MSDIKEQANNGEYPEVYYRCEENMRKYNDTSDVSKIFEEVKPLLFQGILEATTAGQNSYYLKYEFKEKRNINILINAFNSYVEMNPVKGFRIIANRDYANKMAFYIYFQNE